MSTQHEPGVQPASLHAGRVPEEWPEASGFAPETGAEIDLMEYVRLVWARRWVVVAVLVATVLIAGGWSVNQQKLYRSTLKVAVEPAPSLNQNQFDAYVNFWQIDSYIADQIQVLKTRQLAERVAEKLGLEPGQRGLLRINMKRIEDTHVIEVSMTGTDPHQVAEWLNVYMHEYIAANIEAGLERTRQIYAVIQSRLDPLRDQLLDSEESLVEFREREDALLFADQDKNVISEQVNTLTSEYANTKAERIRLETKLNAVRRLRAESLSEASFPEILRDSGIQGLRRQRSDLEVELAERLRTLKEGHPEIQDLRSRIVGLDNRIQSEIEAIRTSLETDFSIVSQREKALYDNIQQLKEQSIQLSRQTLEYDRLKRQYDQNKLFLEDMMARSKEADISSSALLNNARIIEPARPAGAPYTPNVPRTLMVAVLLGLFLGVGLVIGLDFLDNTLRTPEHVERYLGLEALAALPKFTEDNANVLREVFQSLRTALMLAARGEGCQLLMVTSSVPSEGKTTIVFNLGKVLASGGARVLLIDADLRKPRLHRVINVKNVRGLTSVVLGEKEIADVLNTVADAPSLHVLCSGPLPPNPPELYGKASFRRLLDSARESYDWVIIDTPPVASVTDPVICSSVVDMALLVVQYGHARRQIIQGSLRQLARTGVRIAGALINKVDVERDHYYYSYYYSYYYRYGQGYAYGEKPEQQPRSKGKAT